MFRSRMKLLASLVSTLTLFTSQAFAKKSYHTLNNGLDVIIYEDHKVPLATIVLASKAGGFTESPETNGLTHLWEHMFFKGNSELPNQESFNQRVQELGIIFNGDTSAEKVRYYFTLPSVNLTAGLQFMYNAISTPLLEEKELQRERVVVLNEYDRNASQSTFNMNRMKKNLIYKDLAYLRDPLGEREVITNASRQQLLEIKDQVFVPKNSAILISGDIDSQKTLKMVKKIFDAWENPKNWKAIVPKPFPKFPKSGSIVDIHPHAKKPIVQFTFEGPKARQNPNDTYAADILISLLSRQSGQFYQKYLDSGLTYFSGLGYYTQSQAGELTITSSMAADKLKKVSRSLLKEPKKWLKKDYFDEKSLEEVRKSLRVSKLYEVNRPSEYIKTLAFWWAITGMDYYDGYIDNLSKVQLSDVRKFIKKYLINKPYVKTVLVSPKDAKKLKLKRTTTPALLKGVEK